MLRRRLCRLLISALIGPFLITGCASTCGEMAARRRAFLGSVRAATGWHAAVGVPYAEVNRLLAHSLPRVPPYRLPLWGPLEAMLPKLLLTPRRLELRGTELGKLGFLLELQASLDGEAAFSVTSQASVTPLVNHADRTLEVAIRPADFESVQPRLSPGALERLTELIWRRLSAEARGLLPRRLVTEAAGATITLLGTQLHRLLRATLLKQIGEVGRLRLALPAALPLQGLTVRPLGDRSLLILLRTRLPVPVGLDEEAAAALATSRETFRLVVPGATLAAVTNWAMQEKLIPDRFDAQPRPSPDGAYQAALSWKPGPRPLKALIWRTCDQPCAELQLGGQPVLTVQ